jgi:hypothetical protein
MGDLAKLLIPRLHQNASRPDVQPSSSPVGVGDAGSPVLDHLSDAVAQLSSINAYFAVIAAGGAPTSTQLADAQSALGAIGADLRAMQAQPQPPSGSQVWVSAPAAAGLAGMSAVVGGVIGWFAKGSTKKGSRR